MIFGLGSTIIVEKRCYLMGIQGMDAFLAWLKHWLVQLVDMIHHIFGWLEDEEIFPTLPPTTTEP